MPIYDPIHNETWYTKQEVDRLVFTASASASASGSRAYSIPITAWTASGTLYAATITHHVAGTSYIAQLINEETKKTFLFEDDDRSVPGSWTVYLSFLPDFITTAVIA